MYKVHLKEFFFQRSSVYLSKFAIHGQWTQLCLNLDDINKRNQFMWNQISCMEPMTPACHWIPVIGFSQRTRCCSCCCGDNVAVILLLLFYCFHCCSLLFWVFLLYFSCFDCCLLLLWLLLLIYKLLLFILKLLITVCVAALKICCCSSFACCTHTRLSLLDGCVGIISMPFDVHSGRCLSELTSIWNPFV